MTLFDKAAVALAMRYNGQVITENMVVADLRRRHIPVEDWGKEN